MGRMATTPSPDLSMLRDGDGKPKHRPEVPKVWTLGADVTTFHGIDRCDQCGRPLENGQWLVGLCRRCESEKSSTRRVESDE